VTHAALASSVALYVLKTRPLKRGAAKAFVFDTHLVGTSRSP
jgi:hypothetical protein